MEIIDAEVNALSHSPGDAARLAQHLISLATNSELRKKLGLAGRAVVQERFNRERLVKDLAPIYSQLVKDRMAGKQIDTFVAESAKIDYASSNTSDKVGTTLGRFDARDRVRGAETP